MRRGRATPEGSASERERVLPDAGPAAPPRANGELVFAAPWEGRLFGLTLAMLEAGRFEWPEFQSRLIAAIAKHEAERGRGEYRYYACWLEAFCALARHAGWLDPAELAALERELAARPAGHDHGR
jgi:nitrile hydratase accessory protein